MADAIELTATGGGPRWDWSSKVGGHPYLVDASLHPLDSVGNPLAFLAQLNFVDLPSLLGFPTHGLLQFFVSTSTDRAFEHRVLYHAEVPTERIRQEQQLAARVRVPRPLGPDGWPVPWADDVFNPVVKPAEAMAISGRIVDSRLSPTRGHRIGGAPHINQGGQLPDGHVLLFQLDSEPHEYSPNGYRILWGDLGTARFSIAPKDLSRRDFTRTNYTWDNA